MSKIISNLREELKKNSDPQLINSGKRFFKEEVKMYGIKTISVRKIGKEHFKLIKGKTKSEIFKLCEELWKSGYMEESFIACNWSHNIYKDYEPDDFKIFGMWVNTYVSNWASCDTLCNHTVGDFIKMYPQYIEELKKWARSENRWVRRAAAVSLIMPAKEGDFLNDIFEIADILLHDKDDLVRKGYGWMLKAASQSHLNEVFEYVIKNKSAMPRTSLRYAIEKMPEEFKAKAMKK